MARALLGWRVAAAENREGATPHPAGRGPVWAGAHYCVCHGPRAARLTRSSSGNSPDGGHRGACGERRGGAEDAIHRLRRHRVELGGQVHDCTQRPEDLNGLQDTGALGWVDQPAEPAEDVDHGLRRSQGVTRRGGGGDQIVQEYKEVETQPWRPQEASAVAHHLPIPPRRRRSRHASLPRASEPTTCRGEGEAAPW